MIGEVHSFFSFSRIPHLHSKIPANIKDASIGSEDLRFAKIAADMNSFLTPFNCISKRMLKQGSKHRVIISKLNKIFAKCFIVFKVFADISSSFFNCLEIKPYIYTHIHVCLLHNLFLLFACLFV